MNVPRTALLALCVASAACTPPEDRDAGSANALRGLTLTEPQQKPDFTLTDTDGEDFAFARETSGFLTLVFFGYTYCPDICPVHMANLGAVIGQLPPSTARRIKVVFVTTDPQRDTPARLRTWLDNFSRDFIGLTGEHDRVNEVQASMSLPPSEIGEPDSTGFYYVGHAAFIVAFTPDNLARAFYPSGIRQADWAHDIPLLLQFE